MVGASENLKFYPLTTAGIPDVTTPPHPPQEKNLWGVSSLWGRFTSFLYALFAWGDPICIQPPCSPHVLAFVSSQRRGLTEKQGAHLRQWVLTMYIFIICVIKNTAPQTGIVLHDKSGWEGRGLVSLKRWLLGRRKNTWTYFILFFFFLSLV